MESCKNLLHSKHPGLISLLFLNCNVMAIKLNIIPVILHDNAVSARQSFSICCSCFQMMVTTNQGREMELFLNQMNTNV